MASLSCFKAYDIRGKVPDDLSPELAFRIGRAYAAELRPKRVVVGRDVRDSSEALVDALALGLQQGGCEVHDIGLCGTEEVYFATFHFEMDGGIMVTASHNPIGYNGMKLVRAGAQPISGDTGLKSIEARAAEDSTPLPDIRPTLVPLEHRAAYIQHLLGYLNTDTLRPLKIVTNAGNGGAGVVIDALAPFLPFEFIKVHHEPDPTFPNGIPNPLLPENRAATAEAVKAHGADFGVAWDGDFDRCFLFDENARFIEGYYIVGLLAKALLIKSPGDKIIHDPRLTWNTVDEVTQAGGMPIMSKTGHAFIKERMRKENAVYGGEMSAHHYFRDFAYCDNGNIPWLMVAELICREGKSLSQLVDERIEAYPASGEINRKVADADATIAAIEAEFAGDGRIDRTDGLSVDFADWRFNLRKSNTEPVIRLNVESRGDMALMQEKTDAILKFVDAL
ncbi:phosphomannomutase [Abyssibacter profundi]|uniref:phosphomannomutase n=1 Tax=Abyssibacter profundi TaxID=2182787 RepID=A0A383XQF3_9GAMM|nr:phosphomannomutase [Abyssibacter profundi]PWN54857.1 phosphomannomutase [Abyssibacter profundi]